MKKHKKVNNKPKLIVVVVVSLLFLGVLFLLRRSMVSPQVAEIASDQRPPANCISQVESISFGKECSEGNFLNSKYTCKNGQVAERNATVGTCQSYASIMSEALRNCGTTCGGVVVELPPDQYSTPVPTSVSSPRPSASPTPNPSIQVTPPPTSDPNAKPITCKLVTQKIPRGMSGWSPSQIIDTSSASILPGEKLGYAVELTNPNNYQVAGTLKLSTVNMAGADEPVKVDSYGGLCKLDATSKTMVCESSSVTIAANSNLVKPESVLPSMTIVMEANDSITEGTFTGIMFSGSIGDTRFNCEPATSIKIEPNCKTTKPFCLSMLIGRSCPTITTCPNPTPTPTPTPTSAPTSSPSPVASTIATSSPVSIASTSPLCGKQLNTWKYRESCGNGSYRYVDYTCIGDKDSQTLGSSSSCKTEAVWLENARSSCRDMACPTTTPTSSATTISTTTAPSPSIAPRSATKLPFASCYRACRKTKTSFTKCVRSCL